MAQPFETWGKGWTTGAASSAAMAQRPLAVAGGHRTTARAAILFEAFQGADPVAALLILRHGTTATYHIGHTTTAGRAASAHTLLMWTAMCWCAGHGHQWLDLGLVETQRNAGLARFKLGTGADVVPLGGTWVHWPPLRPLRRLTWLDRKAMIP
ncbi:GNAT family N-acetyltransferase [Pseudosulfitobacter pseudonitzschiae]|uniref:GNAT family N-acetyltransferase n=1 Tax=Pseudosulfitobacter pseudonitzschiae TaxID=1402135 RepID=UPI002E0FA051